MFWFAKSYMLLQCPYIHRDMVFAGHVFDSSSFSEPMEPSFQDRQMCEQASNVLKCMCDLTVLD